MSPHKIAVVVTGFCLLVRSNQAAQIEVTGYFAGSKEIALATAAERNDVRRIKELSSEGANVNARGRSDLTPVLLATLYRNKQAYECLMDLGADPNIQFQETGTSALAIASTIEDSSYLEKALTHGGKPNQINPTTGLTPIWRSIQEMLPANVSLLVAAGANVNFADERGVTPLMFAAGANRFDIDLILLDAGANPRLKNKWGVSILWYIHNIRTDPQSKFIEWKHKFIDRLRTLGIDTDHGT